MTTIDLFAGPGERDVAATRLGLNPWGIELDSAACATRKAAGLHTWQADVALALPLLIESQAKRPVIGLIASPPCQTFSMAGKGAGRAALDLVLAVLADVAAGADIDLARFDDPRTGLVSGTGTPIAIARTCSG